MPDGVVKYEDAVKVAQKEGIRIRALIIYHPHNPLGRCYTPDALIGLMQLCNEYKIHLLADKIYALSVYEIDDLEATGFHSILTLEVEKYIDLNYLHLFYGMSKGMAGSGLRLGCIYTRKEKLLRAMSVISPFHWPASSSKRIATLMLEDIEWMEGFLAQSRTRLAAHSLRTRKLLEDQGIEFHPKSNAGLFLWIRLSPQFAKEDLAEESFKKGWTYEDEMTQALIMDGVFLNGRKEMNAEEPVGIVGSSHKMGDLSRRE